MEHRKWIKYFFSLIILEPWGMKWTGNRFRADQRMYFSSQLKLQYSFTKVMATTMDGFNGGFHRLMENSFTSC